MTFTRQRHVFNFVIETGLNIHMNIIKLFHGAFYSPAYCKMHRQRQASHQYQSNVTRIVVVQ